jgi:hypothetical protein
MSWLSRSPTSWRASPGVFLLIVGTLATKIPAAAQ